MPKPPTTRYLTNETLVQTWKLDGRRDGPLRIWSSHLEVFHAWSYYDVDRTRERYQDHHGVHFDWEERFVYTPSRHHGGRKKTRYLRLT